LLGKVRSAGPASGIDHINPPRGMYYYAVFAYDEMMNCSPAALASAFFRAAPGPASNPQPVDRAAGITSAPTLTWTAGPQATEHSIYLGLSPETLVFQQTQTSTSFIPGQLEHFATYYWRIDEVNGPEITAGPVWSFTTRPYRADFDADGDVDQADFGHFQMCFTGGGIPQRDPLCQNAALDDDPDVDVSDFDVFRTCLNGPGIPPLPTCLAP